MLLGALPSSAATLVIGYIAMVVVMVRIGWQR